MEREADRGTEVEAKRSRFQDMAAEGLITLDELRAKLGELEDARRTAEAEAKTLRHRADRARDLELDKKTLLSTYAELVPEQLDALTSDERRQVYGMLRLRWEAGADGTLEGRGLLSENLGVLRGRGLCEDEPTPPRESENTKIPRVTFRAVLGNGSQQVQLELSMRR